MYNLILKQFTSKTSQDAKTYLLILRVILGLILLYLLFTFPGFNGLGQRSDPYLSILLYGVITLAVVFWVFRINNAFEDSEILRATAAELLTSNDNVVDGIPYFNEKHRDDPEEIKNRTIYKIANVYFDEGESVAKKKHDGLTARLKIERQLCVAGIILGLIMFMTPFGLPVIFVLGGYLMYRVGKDAKTVEIHDRAFAISVQWRKDYRNRKTNEEIYNVKGWADDKMIHAAFPTTLGTWVGAGYFWEGQGHILTVGSNRAGKGTTLIIPCLLSSGFTASETSFICLDPKGENAAITSRYVKSQGYDVHILNPFGIHGLSNSRFNPFDYIDKDNENVIEYCDMLAEMLIPIKTNIDSNTEHFDTQARSILSCYMLHMIDSAERSERHFGTLFRWVNYGGEKLDSLLKEMVISDSYRGILATLIEGFIDTKFSGGEKEVSGVFSTMKRGLSPFMNFKLQDATATSDFDLRQIAMQKTGIYVCIPQSEMEKYAVWLRLIMGCSIKLLQKHYNKQRKVLFIMDEFPTLGYMKDFENNAGYMAGFNVSFWVILQLLPQIQNLYPKIWETFVSNAVIKQFLGIGDQTTAEYVSKIMPMDVIFNNRGHVEKEKRLLEPEEVIAFPHIILKHNNYEKPMSLTRLPYYELDWCIERADERPMM